MRAYVVDSERIGGASTPPHLKLLKARYPVESIRGVATGVYRYIYIPPKSVTLKIIM